YIVTTNNTDSSFSPHSIPYSSLISCYGTHRDLHSFPTRRSSDLIPRAGRRAATRAARSGSARAPSGGRAPSDRGDGTRPGAPGRSEEHTSELQSRFDLVCRLLLEKKKETPKRLQDQLESKSKHPN